MSAALSVHKLLLRRSSHFCLDIDSLHVQPGHILGVTGPNGSGKTSLIECLAGLLKPSEGHISIQGKVLTPGLRYSKARLGYIPDDEDWLISELCAQEYFDLLIRVYAAAGVTRDMAARIHSLAATLQFTSFRQPLQSLSHGNKKKVQIIAGLLHTPAILIVDELRNGLDPMAIIAAEQLLKKEARHGATIVAATHDLWWAERFTDEILFLGNGKVLVNDKTRTLVDRHGSLEHFFLQSVQGKAHGMAAV